MVWVNKPDSDESIYPESSIQQRNEAKKRFQSLIEEKQDIFTGGKLSYKLRKGKIFHEIATVARQLNGDLIIAGAHGVSGFEEYWIGSNTYKIVTSAHCPVITIRSDYQFKDKIYKIILPIDHTRDTLEKVPFTLKFAENLQPEYHLLGVFTTELKTLQRKTEQNVEKICTNLKKENIAFDTQFINSQNNVNAIIDYAEKAEADLISIMTEQQKASASLLLGPYAAQIVNVSTIPIMSINKKE